MKDARKELSIFVYPIEIQRWLMLVKPSFDDFYEIYCILPLVEIFEKYYGIKFCVGFPLKESLHHKFPERVAPNDVTKTSAIINWCREENTSSDLLFSAFNEFGKRDMQAISCQLKRYGRHNNDEKNDDALLSKIKEWQRSYRHDEMYIHLVVLVEGYEPDLDYILKRLPHAFQRIIIFDANFQNYAFATNEDYSKLNRGN